MEKRRPTYDLDSIKRAMGEPKTLAITVSARLAAAALGFDRDAVAGVVRTIEARMFVKSMTTLADNRIWQDVYNVPASGFILYVKFQADLVTEFRVVSFKER